MSTAHPSKPWIAKVASVVVFGAVASMATVAPAGADPLPGGPWVAIAGVHGASQPVEVTAADYPQPGITIASQVDETEAQNCTVSWPIVATTDDPGYLTAGHCMAAKSAPLWMYTAMNKSAREQLPPLQSYDRGYDRDGVYHDASVFFLSASQQQGPYGVEIAPGVRLRGVLGVDAVRSLPAGTPMCMNGARSGLTCGPLVRATSVQVRWGGSAVHGDSGAPVFVVDERGEAMAVGMLAYGPTDTDNYVTYLAPVLKRMGLRLVVDNDAKGTDR